MVPPVEVIKKKAPSPLFILPDVEYRFARKILLDMQFRSNCFSNIAQRDWCVGNPQLAFGMEWLD